MPVSIDEFVNGGAPGISAERLNEPFHVKSATYDSGTDTITVTVGRGRVDWGGGNITEFTSDQTLAITPVAVSTTYYVHLLSTGTLEAGTAALPSAWGVTLGTVATGAAKSTLTRDDLRGMLPAPPDPDLAKKWALIL